MQTIFFFSKNLQILYTRYYEYRNDLICYILNATKPVDLTDNCHSNFILKLSSLSKWMCTESDSN